MNCTGINKGTFAEDDCAVSILRAENDDLQLSVLPDGFAEGLYRMMEDPTPINHSSGLYFPLCSYGAQWSTGW